MANTCNRSKNYSTLCTYANEEGNCKLKVCSWPDMRDEEDIPTLPSNEYDDYDDTIL